MTQPEAVTPERLMLSTIKVGETLTLPLIIKTVTARETKAKKPYLSIDFYDGIDTITGNYWDWATGVMPPKNIVFDIKAQVGEWQGNKQLTVKTMHTNTTVPYADFMPSSGHDVEATYAAAYELILGVKDNMLRDLTLQLLEVVRSKWLIVPGALRIHHAYVGGTLIHSLAVARLAKAIAENTPGANVDLATVGGMLHDIGKLYTYEIDGIEINMTDEGMMKEHLFMGAELVGNFAENNCQVDSKQVVDKLELLRHIILSHHGKLDYGAVVTPMCIEAHIVYHADSVDATAEQIREESRKLADDVKWTARIWALDNRLQMTTQYVNAVMTQCEEPPHGN